MFTSTVPAIADLDEDGRSELSLAAQRLYLLSESGSVLPGWPLNLLPEEGFQSPTPVIARFTPSEPLRIIKSSGLANGLVGRIHVLDSRGEAVPGWPVTLPPTFFPVLVKLAVGDVTGDGVADVVAIDPLNRRVYVYNRDGQPVQPFPISIDNRLAFPRAPSLGDLDGDGVAEIVFRVGFRVTAIKGDGTVLPGWPQEMVAAGNFGVALGDVDGDGDLEVTGATVNFTQDFSGGVYIWNGDGTLLPGWPKFVPDTSFAARTIIADVDGDGQGDMIASGLTASLSSGAIYAWKSSGELIQGFPIILNGRPIMFSAPTVADIDRDGIADLGVMSEVGRPNAFIEWFDLGVPYRPEGMEWPTEGHDMSRTGAYSPPVLPVERRPARVELRPDSLQTSTPAVPLIALVTLPADSTLVPNSLRLVEVDGEPVAEVVAHRLGGLANGSSTAGKALFQFDGRAVRDLLGGPGVHRLLFHSDILGDGGGVMYEAEADLTLR